MLMRKTVATTTLLSLLSGLAPKSELIIIDLPAVSALLEFFDVLHIIVGF